MDHDRSRTAAFSGHRILKPADQYSLFGPDGDIFSEEALTERLRETIGKLYNEGCDTFLCGMAEGFDLLAGKAVSDLQPQLPGLKLIPVVPYPGQADRFTSQAKEIYKRIINSNVDPVTVCPHYRPECFHMRNDYLVDNSSVLVCFFNGTKGGTAYTVKQAVRKGLRIINLA